MKRTKPIVLFLASFISGAVFPILLLVVVFFLDPNRMEMRTRRTFYNLEIQRHRMSPTKQDQVEDLVLLLDSKPFMHIFAEDGKIRDMVMLDPSDGGDSESAVLSMTVSDVSGQWSHLYYGKNPSKHQTYHTGVIYEDMDFDGDFDRKDVCDETGQVRHTFIAFQEEWLEVNSVDSEKGIAQKRSQHFSFVPYSGWKVD